MLNTQTQRLWRARARSEATRFIEPQRRRGRKEVL